MAGMYVGVSKLPFNVSGSLEGGLEFNTRGQNQYFVFVGNGSRISASANASYDIFIELYQRGELLGSADNTTLGTESLSITTQTGELYILVLTGLKETEGEYPVTLSITSP